jgi:hypothetical protein
MRLKGSMARALLHFVLTFSQLTAPKCGAKSLNEGHDLIRLMMFSASVILGSMTMSEIGSAAVIELPMPHGKESLPAIDRINRAIYVVKDQIYLLTDNRAYFVESTFKYGQKEQWNVFGDLEDIKRIKFKNGPNNVQWRGLWRNNDDVLLMFDGKGLATWGYSFKSKVIFSHHSIVWDQIKPPRDRSGAPTRTEILKTRSLIRKMMKKVKGAPMVGIADKPKSWGAKLSKPYDSEFMVATRINKFPIVEMKCGSETSTRCSFVRQCYVRGTSKVALENNIGIAAEPKSRAIYVGASDGHTIHKLKYNSCYDIRYIKSIKTPKKLPVFTSLSIDDGQRLWVTFTQPDNYNNSAAAYWDKGLY